MEEYLNEIYFDPKHPASFSSPEKLYKWVKQDGRFPVNRKNIQKWLSGVESYTLHREAKIKFPRNKVYVSKPGVQWDCDLIHMVDYSSVNNGNKYVLICIDVFSRFVWLRGIKTKKPQDVMGAFKDIFKTVTKPLRIRTDKGAEFTSQACEKFFKSQNILHMLAQNTETKANYAERAIKTIKMRIQRYFTQKQTHKYIDKLQDFASSYNNTYHRSIKKAPAEVNSETASQTWFTQYAEPLLYKSKKRKQKDKFKVGDLVRISHIRKTFQREYDERWTGELFRIITKVTSNRIPMFRLKDYSGEIIQGLFYPQELQQVSIDENQPYKIGKILKTRKQKGVKQYFVNWKYWPPKYNSWIDASTVEDI
jgi:ribosomal protein S17